MRKWILGIIVLGMMALALIGVGVIGRALVQQGQPTPIPAQAQSAPANADTASIYFSDLYQGEGVFPLHTWQRITVYCRVY